MPEETLFEFESPQTRAEIAARLRSLADGFDAGGPVTLTAEDGETTTVTPPDRPDFELEAEREWDGDDEDAAEVSIEAEIEWAEADVEAEAEVEDRDGAESEDEPTAAEDDGDDGEQASVGSEAADEVPVIEPNGEAELPTAATGDAETTRSLGQFQLYVDRAGKWRWRLVHRNGNIIAASGQGYASRQKAQQGMHSVMANAPDAEAITIE